MGCLGEANPDIEYTQTTAQPSHESIFNQVSQCGIPEQQMIFAPIGSPWKDDQKHARSGAHKNEDQHRQPSQPNLHPARLHVRRGRA